jgi:hypothetical protein
VQLFVSLAYRAYRLGPVAVDDLGLPQGCGSAARSARSDSKIGPLTIKDNARLPEPKSSQFSQLRLFNLELFPAHETSSALISAHQGPERGRPEACCSVLRKSSAQRAMTPNNDKQRTTKSLVRRQFPTFGLISDTPRTESGVQRDSPPPAALTRGVDASQVMRGKAARHAGARRDGRPSRRNRSGRDLDVKELLRRQLYDACVVARADQ